MKKILNTEMRVKNPAFATPRSEDGSDRLRADPACRASGDVENGRREPDVCIVQIADPYSFHLIRWLRLFRLAGIGARFETASAPRTGGPEGVPISFLCPRWLRRPALVRYLWAGLVARRRLRATGELLHAHCAAGSGFAARLSGCPYVVTTYGSEIYDTAERGRLYRWMVHLVLHGATLVTASTPRMAEALQENFKLPAERIRTFTLGFDADVFQPVTPTGCEKIRRQLGAVPHERLWVINRRTLWIYRTAEVVSGFLRFCDDHPQGRLTVIDGDADAQYSREVRGLIDASKHRHRVTVVREFLTPAGMAQWLQAADFAISVPQTDQLSTAVLEAMACGAVPLLSDLRAYDPLRDCAPIRRISDCTAAGFTRMFAETSRIPQDELARQQGACARFVSEHFSEESILDEVRALYGLPPRGEIANCKLQIAN
jgi:glycosyltransferase involved in cell wall biosynthesis